MKLKEFIRQYSTGLPSGKISIETPSGLLDKIEWSTNSFNEIYMWIKDSRFYVRQIASIDPGFGFFVAKLSTVFGVGLADEFTFKIKE